MHCSKIMIAIIFTATLAILTSCSGNAPETPPESVIIANIKNVLKPGIDVDVIRFKVFPNEQDISRGRISVAGTLITTEERVDIATGSSGRLFTMALERGINRDQYVRYARKSGFLKSHRKQGATLYDVILPSGSKLDFTADLLYKQTIDGFEFHRKVSYDIPGTAITELKNDYGLHLVYGTPKFNEQFEKLLGWHKYEMETLPAKFQEIFGRLADGASIVDDGGTVGTIEPFNLAAATVNVGTILGPDGRHREGYIAKIPIIIDPVKELAMSGGTVTKANKNVFSLAMHMDYHDPKLSTACIYFKAERYASNSICWDGSAWKAVGKRYGIIDHKTKKQLSVQP